ncbi:MAG: hypothetical protein HC803_05050 [Saprospiraceae bacterium]|nr:hypothetical protein [Saprospiraceae bacterium]
MERTFTLGNAPKDAKITYEANLSSLAMESSITTDGKWEQTKSEKRQAKGLSGFDVVGKLILNNDKATVWTMMFTAKPLIIDTRNESAKAEEEEIPAGAKLIAKTDCPTCHNAFNQTVGPAYIDIAKRYELTADNVTILTNKIIVGGSGTWGEAAMTPHPDLERKDVTEMVKYILSLDADEEAEGSVGGFKEIPKEKYRKADAAAEKKNILPGTLAKAYVSKKICRFWLM